MNIEQTAQTADIASVLEPLENIVSGTFLDNSIFYILIIVGVTFIIAYIVKFIFSEILSRIFSKTKTDLDDHVVEILEKPVFKTVL